MTAKPKSARSPKTRKCYCSGKCPVEMNGYCEIQAGASCYTSVEEYIDEDTGLVEYDRNYGCLPPDESSLLQCKGNLLPQATPIYISCCSHKDFCNMPTQEEPVTLPPDFHQKRHLFHYPATKSLSNETLALFAFVLVAVSVLSAWFGFCVVRRRRQNLKEKKQLLLGMSCGGSGSGSGSGIGTTDIGTDSNFRYNRGPRFVTEQTRASAAAFEQMRPQAAISAAAAAAAAAAASTNENLGSLLFSGCCDASNFFDQSRIGSEMSLTNYVQRTLSNNIEFMEVIHRGRFNEVWTANFLGQKICAKIVYDHAEALWLRETEIYQSPMLRHQNVLTLIASDVRVTIRSPQMILVTEYQQNGSLQDYLHDNVLDRSSLLTMMYSLTRGIVHLHTEAFGSDRKPAIAHRNLKSKNVLVKADGQCCISNFGRAVRFCSKTNEVERCDLRQSTARYMAPEILSESIKFSSLESFKSADVYSLGLILWEMTRRCYVHEQTLVAPEEAQLPYADFTTSAEPTHAEMVEIVAVNRFRPSLRPIWDSDSIMAAISKLITECWHHDPHSRLTALRLNKSLAKLDTELHEMSSKKRLIALNGSSGDKYELI